MCNPEVYTKENFVDTMPSALVEDDEETLADAVADYIAAPPQAPEAPRQGPEIGVALDPPVSLPQKIVIQDVELHANSSVYDLRQAAKFFGVSQAGSKSKIYERICATHLLALRRQAVEVAESAYQRDIVEPRISLPVRAQ